jgi:hypothetical protein
MHSELATGTANWDLTTLPVKTKHQNVESRTNKQRNYAREREQTGKFAAASLDLHALC